jgi:putative phage-type endonuclease
MKAREHAAWLSWRDQGVGSSDAPIIMKTSPWTTPFELWARKTGRLLPQRQNEAMRRGLRLEPRARRIFEEKTGITMPPAKGEHRVHNFMRATFDGINHEKKCLLEMKCPGRQDHEVALAGRVPEKYVWQTVHQLFVAELPVLYYWSYYNDDDCALVVVERNRKLENQLVPEAMRFWKHVVDDVPPPFEIPKVTASKTHGRK